MATGNSRYLRVLGLALALCAPTRVGAGGRWQTPYDPDFPEAPAAEPPAPAPAPPPAAGPEGGAVTPAAPGDGAPAAGEPELLLPAGMKFLLLDRPDPDRLFGARASTETKDMTKFLANFKPFRLTQARWDRMRDDYEQGKLPSEEEEEIFPLLPLELFASTGTTPSAPPPEVELPTYGTSLSVTGRKVVGFNFSEKRYMRDQTTTGRPKSLNLIDIQQQLQLRMQGKVGPKITVNVDYDDTKTNKQDISVVYTGDPNEVVQNASFGDIDLSLPATEFVSYNKQLFGIRADVKYKGFKGSFIGSRTKGQTKTKQFIGNTQFSSIDLLDTSYIRRAYYDVSFGTASRLPIQAGTERILLATQDPRTFNTNSQDLNVEDLVAGSTFTAKFTQLAAGTDYTIDYIRGIVQFRIPIDPNYLIAVDYAKGSGGQLSSEGWHPGWSKLIKTPGDVPISTTTEVGYNRELKTFYSLGQTQVVRDNGRGNFILKVLDPKRNEVGPGLNPLQQYPDTIEVDFENGLFRLQNPFGLSVASPTPDPEVYAPVPISKRLFHLEYQFRLKTFFLEPNLVIQSEVVLIDGLKLVRNVDYFIDYESGFITFFNENRIGPNSVVDLSYEVAPFAGTTSESILGTRVSHDFNQHFSIGSTLLYQAGSKSPTVPSITDLAKSLLIYEVDSQFKSIKLFRWLTLTGLQVEYARSEQNPNLNKFALIDNMEGSKQEDAAPMFAQGWQFASNPTSPPADPRALATANIDIPILTINPGAQANSNETQKVLGVTADFALTASTEVSIVHVFSPTGLDFSQKQTLEITMNGDGSNNELNFSLGGINEDADGRGGMTLSCQDGRLLLNAPKTEDTNCDGLLQPSEDIGWTYAPNWAGAGSATVGAGNGRIDTEDLNQNQRLDAADGSGDNFGYNASALTPLHQQFFDITSSLQRTKIDWTGWHTFQIPLDVSTGTLTRWNAIKEIRVSIRKKIGGANATSIQFARIAVVGNSWQRGQAGDPSNAAGAKATEKLSVTAVNNSDNPGYIPIFNAGGEAQGTFNDLYGSISGLQQQANSKNLTEQALQLLWQDLPAGATIYTKRLFPHSINVAQHKRFNFLLYANASPAGADFDTSGKRVFFLRAGSDQSFFEVRVPLQYQGWQRVSIAQTDTTGDQQPDMWSIAQAPQGSIIVSSGTPNLQQVAAITAGIYSAADWTSVPAVPRNGAVWLNDIYVSDPIQRSGVAQKLQLDLDIPGWMSFGGKYRYVDRNYQTPTTVVSNQDNRQDTAYLNLIKLAWFPMNFNLSRTVTETPNVAQTGDLSNLVTLLQSGRVTQWNGTASGNFAYGTLPRLSLGYVRALTEYDLLQRRDDRRTYNSAFSYGIPIQSRFLPQTVDLTYSYSKYSVSFNRFDVRRLPGNFNTDEHTNTYGGRLSFTPWTGSSFNPNFSMTEVKETRSDLSAGQELVTKYPKSVNETVGFSSNFRLLSWFNPAVNYTITNIENNVLTVSTFIVNGSTTVAQPGDVKTINRNATGSINLLLNVSDIWKKTRLLRSFSLANGYQLQDGDVWNNVEKGISSKAALWIRTPFHPTNGVGSRANLTLRDTYNSTQRWSPLEAYNILGRKAAFKTLSLSNNYVYSVQRTETTGTPAKTIATTLPDIVASLSQLERLVWADRWMQNGQVNLKYQAHTTEIVQTSLATDHALGIDLRAIIRKTFDTTLSMNLRDSDQKDLRLDVITNRTHHEDATIQTTFDLSKFRFTPKVDYAKDTTELGTGVKQADVTVITPSILSRADLALPRGLMLPFTGKTLLFTNRIIWTSTLSMALRKSPVTQADNSKMLTFNTSGDYELAKNLRMTLSGAFARLWHKFLKEEDFISYQFGTTLTFQF